MRELAGRTAVVTGAARGIGFALSTRLVSEGMQVVMADLDDVGVEEAARALRADGATVTGHVVDVADAASVDALADAAEHAYGNLHLIVNNAGVGAGGRAWEIPLVDWKWVVDICFWGVVHGMHSFVPRLIAHGDEAHVVNTSSMMGLGTAPGGGPYQASKHAVTAVSEGLAFDLAQVAPQVGVTVLCPGYVDTRIAESAGRRPSAQAPTAGVTATKPTPGTARPVPPSEIADLAVRAVRDRQFYALADWDIWQPRIHQRFEAIEAAAEPVVVALE